MLLAPVTLPPGRLKLAMSDGTVSGVHGSALG
jgi:hypothetical protein